MNKTLNSITQAMAPCSGQAIAFIISEFMYNKNIGHLPDPLKPFIITPLSKDM